MKLYAFLLFVHVLAIVVWVGGLFLMHFAVRPAATQLLEPPQRLPLLLAILERFLGWVMAAVLLSLATGVLMIFGLGMAARAEGASALAEGMRVAHPSVHAMALLGLAMMAIYAHVRFAPFKRLRAAVAAKDWAAGAAQLGQIRRLVGVNLVLGVATIAVATLGRALF